MQIAVVFLARGTGAGLAAVRGFLSSYREHPAGVEHRLVVAAKGWENEPGYDTMRQWVANVDAEIIDLPDDGYDWGAYFRVAERLHDDWVCFLNTHSRILHDNWLRFLIDVATKPGIGAVGCTGSWGTAVAVPQFALPTLSEVFRNRGWLRAVMTALHSTAVFPARFIARVPRFPQFPNPHLRSNAFLTPRALFLQFASRARVPRSKVGAFQLECGRRGFTRSCDRLGLALRVVDSSGNAYPPETWIESQTFRVPGQRGLLVSDNQTRAYDSADRYSRRMMELSSWGHFMTK